MNRKRLFYIILSVIFMIVIAVVMIYLCLSPKADIRTPASVPAPVQESPSSSSITDVTEYIAVSELTDEASLTAAMQEEVKTNPCTDLSVPTYITKTDDTYFIVDCYHNQVIYHDNLDDPLYEWRVMTDEINMGHTLASDGVVYLVDDTENNRILVFEKKNGRFLHTQTFSDIGNRPHYIIYDESTDTFYAWSSMSGEMYLFRHNSDDTRMYLIEIRRIETLSDVYVRSFTILDGDIYFVSGNSSIIRADLNTFEILDTYPVPDEMAGMIQLTKIQDYFYLTISTDITGNQDYATIIRTKKLSNLIKGKYEDIYENFIGGGTPYYITNFDDSYFLTEHRLPGHSVWRFQVIDNKLSEVQTIY
ncbi:MAG: hypothetical protein NC231_05835 [Bacillus sp. (in: Bacteria)]|nr:hypothetical protein [Bacillus sp. (in: firmicutes)]MCM1426862.1 hypothetical protein [Eubacterium sp.]